MDSQKPKSSYDRSDDEKVVRIIEVSTARGIPHDPDAHLGDVERAEIDRKLVRKLDLQLIPWAVFFSAAAVSGSFGGLLAAAIGKMDGLGGRPGWAWIFILEGLATVLFGFLSFFVHDFPDTATFLTEQDRARVIRRPKLDNQSSVEHEEFEMAYLWAAIKDWKMYLGMFIYMGADMPLYGFSLFLTSIISSMGYTSTTKAQLMSVPPYVCAAIFTIAVGICADRTGRRGLCNIFVSMFGIVGFGMHLGSQNPRVKYAGTFLGALGIYPFIPNTIAWVSNNIEGYKRGIVLGFVIGWGNINGLVSSNIFFQAPRYTAGHAAIMGYMVTCLVIGSTVMHVLLKSENAAKLSGRRDYLVAGKSDQEVETLGDNRPDFLYTT
ncbi:uncharacterized protein BP5553_09547 [Venustampulla echinocandica]|uniref:Major facilitator superfamily (MFS) profile domain-containing protein n=1 Tax=Venustampulla echinocandica TaxID=2656787 RepID=A0A370TBA9_9HELO|nr:uncharacterized protein BP5553_09547 [Venustampulla echinocandica]RDL31338.1 hypothetical protein BP5553_09547 [Venustampulla echinocandica]